MSIIKKVISKIFPSTQAIRVRPWIMANGDRTLRLNYDLDENSVVFDLGGYEGQWSSDLFSKYQCTIFVFEPFPEFARNIQNRFSKNFKIKVFGYGLGKENKRITLYSQNDASSTFKTSGQSSEIEIVKASYFISDDNVKVI